ncbi:MAG: DNA topoisomerase IV [Flavobacterium sp.]|nr:DNA topoisomerase IV [Flavobacterium sp.]
MKRLLFAFVPLLLISCYDVERNCSDFRTGEFEFVYEVDGVKKTTTFIRTEDTEIDFYEGKADTSSVRWINDCEYIVQKINPKNMEEKKAIAMKILTTSENSYTFEFGVVGSANKQRGTVTKIK